VEVTVVHVIWSLSFGGWYASCAENLITTDCLKEWKNSVEMQSKLLWSRGKGGYYFPEGLMLCGMEIGLQEFASLVLRQHVCCTVLYAGKQVYNNFEQNTI